ncbi:MAG: polyprenyl synthetase family protein [Candidatus Ancillula sp.]|nr:polyprenyl synthetase family protein [Candidatus Ancillula sp.]
MEFYNSTLVDVSAESIADSLESYFEELTNCIMGGKLTRTMKFLNYADVDESNLKDMHVCFCAALEFFQTAMLIHDDIIDQDVMRRGRIASHIALGKNEALLLGDFVLSASSWCFSKAQMLAEVDGIPCSTRMKLSEIWFKMHRDVILGQVLDTRLVNTPANELFLDETAQQKMAGNAQAVVFMKTASYTTVAPALLGFWLSGEVDASAEAKIWQLEMQKGVEFQRDNDLKDLEKDIQAGKISALIVELLEKLPKSEQAHLDVVTKGKCIKSSEVDELRDFIKRRS